MRSPQAPKLCQQNVFRSLKDFSDIVYFIVYFKVVFKLSTQGTKPGSGLAVCSQGQTPRGMC